MENIITAVIKGVLASIANPCIKSWLEKRKQRFLARQRFTTNARLVISKIDSKSEFLQHEIYMQLKPHLSKETFSFMTKEGIMICKMGDENIVKDFKEYVLSDICVLEKKWKLI